MIDIGQKMRFIPHWNINEHDDEATKREKTVVGTVVYVNRPHRNFAVEYNCGGTMQKETFNFSEIGKNIFKAGGKRNGR